MGHKFAEIAFTEQVKKIQAEQGSRTNYAQMEQGPDFNNLLSQREVSFIQARDSFYMASVSETNWPYVQHRGGPQGFLRIIDATTIGFADFTGNRQYVSAGNFKKNDRVSLILMDYPNRTRLKILGRIIPVASDDLDTLAQLEDPNYRAKIERAFIIKIAAFDWNCPKYITPRYDEKAIEDMIAPIISENKTLKSAKKQKKELPKVIGNGELELIVTGIRQLTPRIRAYELRSYSGGDLPVINAGAHLEIPVLLAGNKFEKRHYSICSNPNRRDIYEIAVLQEIDGMGGSVAIHEQVALGQNLKCSMPQNHFELPHDDNPVILIAGGIGITAIKSMAQELQSKGKKFTIHYAGRSRKEMAFVDRLQREFTDKLSIYPKDENKRLDLTNIINSAANNATFYLCGPEKLLTDFKQLAQQNGIATNRIHFERFNKVHNKDDQPIKVTLAKSNKTLTVTSEQSILEAMIEADINIPYSCQTGSCKTCQVKVLNGIPEHLDLVLSEKEKTEEKLFCPCVSRAKSANITLDI
ncbi:MAG: 2Fe-2S iron-sulfur cluster binding domain-containing protein [Colwellia sp.]|nr:2Fe-2S iron-sulfur cluster binding domain-containing protein [Colwellia sp.]